MCVCLCVRPSAPAASRRAPEHACIRRQTAMHAHTHAHVYNGILSGGRRRGAVCACARTLPRSYVAFYVHLPHTHTYIHTHVTARVWRSLCWGPNEGRQASKLGRAGAARAAILLDSGWKTSRALVTTTTTTHHVDAVGDDDILHRDVITQHAADTAGILLELYRRYRSHRRIRDRRLHVYHTYERT